MTNTKLKTTIIRNIEIRYPRLVKGKLDPYGKYSLQMVADASRAEELSAFGRVKDLGDGLIGVNVSRYPLDKNKKQVTVEVVDAQKEPFTDVDKIGNGTKANLKVFQYQNPMGTISTRLMAAQIVELVEYVPSENDFDTVDTAATNQEEDF
jgi:hypothetical protein